MNKRYLNAVLLVALAANLFLGARNYGNSAEPKDRDQVFEQMRKFSTVMEQVRMHYVDAERSLTKTSWKAHWMACSSSSIRTADI